MGNDEPILAGKRVLEKELEKLQRKLNGPKNTAKHIEAKQNWINRESKRIEAESAKLAERQENFRVRKETLSVACEEIKILREELLREGERDRTRSRERERESSQSSLMSFMMLLGLPGPEHIARPVATKQHLQNLLVEFGLLSPNSTGPRPNPISQSSMKLGLWGLQSTGPRQPPQPPPSLLMVKLSTLRWHCTMPRQPAQQ